VIRFVRGGEWLVVVLSGAMAVIAGCKVDQAAFDARVFACDPSAKNPGCGKDQSGTAMTCYPASLLDGTDFCAPGCGGTPMSTVVSMMWLR